MEAELEDKTVQDPGKAEGLSQEEIASEEAGPPEGSERWNKIYWQAQEGKRIVGERDKLIEDKKSDEKLITEMRRHNAALEKSMTGIQKAVDKPTEGPDTLEEANKTLGNMEDKLKTLKMERSQARKDLEHEKADTLDDSIMELTLNTREMKGLIEKKKAAPLKKEPSPEPEALSKEDAEVYDKWLDGNSQIEENPRALRFAQKIEKEIFAEPKFKDTLLDEVLDEVTVRVYKKMDWNIEDKNKGGRISGPNLVESSSASRSRTSTKDVKLTEVDLKLAKGFGVSVEQVARQKVQINKERLEVS